MQAIQLHMERFEPENRPNRSVFPSDGGFGLILNALTVNRDQMFSLDRDQGHDLGAKAAKAKDGFEHERSEQEAVDEIEPDRTDYSDRDSRNDKEVAEETRRTDPAERQDTEVSRREQDVGDDETATSAEASENGSDEAGIASDVESAGTAQMEEPTPAQSGNETVPAATQAQATPSGASSQAPLGAPAADPSDMAAPSALERAAGNAALNRNVHLEAPQSTGQGSSSAGSKTPQNGGQKPSTAPVFGAAANGAEAQSQSMQAGRSGLQVSVQNGALTSQPSHQITDPATLSALQEQANIETKLSRQGGETAVKGLAQAAKAEGGLANRAAAGANGHAGRRDGGFGQQRGNDLAQLLQQPRANAQTAAPSAQAFSQAQTGTVASLNAGAAVETASMLTPSGQSLPLTAGSPSGIAQAAAQAATPEQLRQGLPAQTTGEQISVHIQKAVKAGTDRINIQLHPAEMGKIEVKIELNDDGQLRAVISAERPETLDLLQRDARGLEKALQDAGLKTDMNSLAFQKGGGNAHDPEQGPQDQNRQTAGTDESQPGAQDAAERRSLHDGSLDISV